MLTLFVATVAYSAENKMMGPPTQAEMQEAAKLLSPPSVLQGQTEKVGVVACLAVIWQENDYMFDDLTYYPQDGKEAVYSVTGIRNYAGTSRISNYHLSLNPSGGCDVLVRQVTYTAKSCKEVRGDGQTRPNLLPWGKLDIGSSETGSRFDPASGQMLCAKERAFIVNAAPIDIKPPRESATKAAKPLFDADPNRFLTIDGRYEGAKVPYR